MEYGGVGDGGQGESRIPVRLDLKGARVCRGRGVRGHDAIHDAYVGGVHFEGGIGEVCRDGSGVEDIFHTVVFGLYFEVKSVELV